MPTVSPNAPDWRQKLGALVESRRFQNFIVGVILFNALTLGLETSDTLMENIGTVLLVLDKLALTIFVIEIILKLLAHGSQFFRDGWNVFDFIIVGIALIPSAGALSVLRTFRILRVFRLMSVVPSMRKVVGALVSALPGMGSIASVLTLVFYIGAVLATKLFGASFPDFFGTIGKSMFSLFQVMTLESWSMSIVRPVMDVYPWAWMFFVPFIIVTTFAVLNLFIGVIVDAMQAGHHEVVEEMHQEEMVEEREQMALLNKKIDALMAEVQSLRDKREP
jgi:voltage-gated sodium channel